MHVVRIFPYETSFIYIIFKDSYFAAQNTHHYALKMKTHLMPCREFTVSLSKSDVYVSTVCGSKLQSYAIVAAVPEGLNF